MVAVMQGPVIVRKGDMEPALDEGAPCRKEGAGRTWSVDPAVQASKFGTYGVFRGFDAVCAKPYANACQQQETPRLYKWRSRGGSIAFANSEAVGKPYQE